MKEFLYSLIIPMHIYFFDVSNNLPPFLISTKFNWRALMSIR